MTTIILVALGVAVLGLVSLALLAAADVRYGTSSAEARRRPLAAAGRVLRDLVNGPVPLPGSEWAQHLESQYAAPDHVSARRARICLARQAVEDLRPRLAVLAWPDYDETPADVSHRVEDARSAAVALLRAVIDERDAAADHLTVVLFGRTKAGKSSLYAALTGQGHEGIGDGGQNFTKELRSTVICDVAIVDSPGIHGVGSQPLEEATERAVYAADVLVVQFTEDAFDLEDFKRLESLGRHERPVVVAINVKKADLGLLTERPDKVFRPKRIEPYVKRIRERMPARWRDASVVVYHALGAASARQAPRRIAPYLWQASRIEALIAAIREASVHADRYALRAADEALCEVLTDLQAQENAAEEELGGMIEETQAVLAEVKGILSEVGAGRSVAHRAIEEHFMEVEEGVSSAITLSSGDYQEALRAALDRDRLAGVLEDRLRVSADELAEKYDDFRADVELAARISVNTAGLENMRAAWQDHRIALARHERNRKWRRVGRMGSKLLVGSISVLQPEAAPVAIAVGVGIDRVFRDPGHAPSDDPAERQVLVREVLAAATQDAKREFSLALDAQVIGPAAVQLVDPVQRHIDRLQDLRRRTREAIRIEDEALHEVRRRLKNTTDREAIRG